MVDSYCQKEIGAFIVIDSIETAAALDARLATLREKLAETEPFLAAVNSYSIAFIMGLWFGLFPTWEGIGF